MKLTDREPEGGGPGPPPPASDSSSSQAEVSRIRTSNNGARRYVLDAASPRISGRHLRVSMDRGPGSPAGTSKHPTLLRYVRPSVELSDDSEKPYSGSLRL